MQKFHFFIFILVVIITQACTVSLINTGIDYSVLESFSLDQFNVKDSNAPPTSGQTFSEQLKDRILNNTRLRYVDEDGDVQFSGDVTGYNITALAPQADQTVAFQRLTIQITIDYKDIKQKDGANDWNQNFSRFANFSADQDLSTVENALIEEIYGQVLDDVFNKAFSGW